MKISPKKLSRKILIFVFLTSFILIIGSLIYFYFSGLRFIHNSARNELQVYYQNFNQALERQLKECNNEIDAVFIGINQNLNVEDPQNKVKKFLSTNGDLVKEFYYLNHFDNSITLAKTVIVFGGEQIINFHKIDSSQFLSDVNQIIPLFEFHEKGFFGSLSKNKYNEYFIHREYLGLKLYIKLNKLAIHNKIIDRIYHPSIVNFTFTDSENVVNYSTNKHWSKQSFNKNYESKELDENFYLESKNNFLYGIWENQILQNNLIISIDISGSYSEFYNIIYKLLFYSIIVYLIIAVFTVIYSLRITKSLDEISNVTRLVGEGNFDSKINITRDDELGLLIESFNKMTFNLKESYKKLNITNKELEQKIDELTKTRVELTKQQKLALVGETISKISHEIQNKISGVSVWIQNLEMQSSNDENIKFYVTEIKKSLNSFVEMLLNFKKFYRKPYLEKSEVDLNSIIKRAVSNYLPDIKAKKIMLKQNLKSDIESLILDKNLIEEVIVNLLANAIYFSPNEGIIIIHTETEKHCLVINLFNNGQRINKEDISNVFHPFFTTKSSGSGLGLAICKNIVEAHEGKISVRNNIDKGVTFKITLPI
jgi:signal transduction histidine kinase